MKGGKTSECGYGVYIDQASKSYARCILGDEMDKLSLLLDSPFFLPSRIATLLLFFLVSFLAVVSDNGYFYFHVAPTSELRNNSSQA